MWTIKHDLDQSEYIRLNHFPLATSMYWQAGKTLKAAQDHERPDSNLLHLAVSQREL